MAVASEKLCHNDIMTYTIELFCSAATQMLYPRVHWSTQVMVELRAYRCGYAPVLQAHQEHAKAGGSAP